MQDGTCIELYVVAVRSELSVSSINIEFNTLYVGSQRTNSVVTLESGELPDARRHVVLPIPLSGNDLGKRTLCHAKHSQERPDKQSEVVFGHVVKTFS